MFGDYMVPERDVEDRVYEEVTSVEDLYKVAELGLTEYNATHKTRMELVIFRLIIDLYLILVMTSSRLQVS